MKLFKRESLLKKVAISILMVIIVEFSLAKPVEAVDWGGTLLNPVKALTTAIGDVVVFLLHASIMGQDDTLETVGESTASKVGKFALKAFLATIPGINIFVTTDISINFYEKYFKEVPEGEVRIMNIEGKDGKTKKVVGTYYKKESLPETIALPKYTFSAEEIFKGNILLFNVDFFDSGKEIYAKLKNGTKDVKASSIENDKEVEYYYYYKDGEDEEDGKKFVITSKHNTALELQTTISRWYNSLRNICLVFMMSVLLYVAIRMMLTSLAAEKAKYKQMLVDWLIGICLLFFLHYIMAFSVSIVKQITKIVNINSDDSSCYVIVMQDDDNHVLSSKIKEMGLESYIDSDNNIIYPTNLMGKMKLESQMENDSVKALGYAICFIVLIFYAVFFAFIYLKRVITMTFLTLIAPIVALTYPIDKITDGQAQGFNKWLKEYIYNLLIQPVHLLLYTVLISSAFEFARTNILYSIVALGSMIPAEKMLRSLVGIEKATTPPSPTAAAAGAGLFVNGMNKLLKNTPSKLPGGSKDSGGGNKPSGDSDNTRTRFNNNFDSIDALSTDVNNGGNRGQDGRNGNRNGNGNNEGRGAHLGNNGQQNNDNGVQDDNMANRNILTPEEQYMQDGFAPNSEGIYFNPSTDEYDEDYNPANDPMYNTTQGNEVADYDDEDRQRQEAYDRYAQEGYATNEDGIYYNPNTQEYDVNYDPADDENFAANIPENNEPDAHGNEQPQPEGNESPNQERNNPPEQETPEEENNREQPQPSKMERLKRAASAGASYAFASAGRKIKQEAPKLPGKAIRFTTGAVIGGTAATLGVAAGVASGNVKNVATYGIAGGAAGAAAGRNVGAQIERIPKAVSNAPIVKEMQKEYYGEEEYSRRKQEKQIKEWKKNQQYRKELEEAVGIKATNEMYKNGEIEEYLKYDIDDAKSIATVHKMQEDGLASSRKEAIAAHKYANRIGDTKKMTAKQQKEWRDTIEKEIQDAGYNEEQTRAKTDKAFDLAKNYHKMKKKF